MKRGSPSTRSRAVARIRARLLRFHTPRFDLAVIVLLTGAAGFLASFGLLRLGVDSMALRYPAAVGTAYLAFLALLWVWLHVRHNDGADAIEDATWRADSSRAESHDVGASDLDVGGGDGLDVGDIGDVGGLDEGVFVLVVLVVLFGGLVLVASVVWSAPVLLAEIALDAAVAAGLHKRLRGLEPSHWLESAIARTWKQFLGMAVLLAVAGLAMQAYAPGALTLGGVMQQGSSGAD